MTLVKVRRRPASCGARRPHSRAGGIWTTVPKPDYIYGLYCHFYQVIPPSRSQDSNAEETYH